MDSAAARCLCATFMAVAILLGAVGGCASAPHPNLAVIQQQWSGPTTRSISKPVYDPDVLAVCAPPDGWKPDPLKKSANHTHQVWLSPTGATAYGVIHFSLPLPVGASLALSGFLSQMKKTEGAANLIERKDDPNLPGIRFVAEGGKYRIRANLIVEAWQGWVIYAGTLVNGQILADELDIAERAREHTKVGQPDNSGS